MADLASSEVTILRSWNEGGLAQKDLVGMRVSIVLAAMGTATNKIPASAFGLKKFEAGGPFVSSNNGVITFLTPDAAGDNLLAVNLAQATDANRADPADLTGTFIGVVKGYA